MKRLLLILTINLFVYNCKSQSIYITQLSAYSVTAGINVNLETVSLNGAGYLNYTNTINSNSIILDVCYWFNFTLPVLTFNNTFFIPLSNEGIYNITVNTINSSSQTDCDYYSTTCTQNISVNYLSNNQFIKSTTSISPNPFTTNFNIQTEEAISNYSLSDISGKQLIDTTSKNEIDNLSSQLNSGVYFLNIQFENGQNGNYKLIKK